MSSKPWCPWCLDAACYAGESWEKASAEVEAAARTPTRVVAWTCKRCLVSLSAPKWAKAMRWAAYAHGISGTQIEAELEHALGEAKA